MTLCAQCCLHKEQPESKNPCCSVCFDEGFQCR